MELVEKKSVEVARVNMESSTVRLVTCKFVELALVSTELVAVRLLTDTLPVKLAESLKVLAPENTLFLTVAEDRDRLSAVPLVILGYSIVVSRR